jgi:hypothetical protein
VRVDELAVLHDGYGCRGNAGLLENLSGNAVDAVAKSRVQVVDGLGCGRCGQQSGEEDGSKYGLKAHNENLILLMLCAGADTD